jgi:PST family polysaccharide transporter
MGIRNKTINGVFWNGVGNVIRQLFLIITMIIMARYLSPEDFGTFAILMIFVMFMTIFSSMGTSQSIIQMESYSSTMLSSIFYFNIIIGIVFFAVLSIFSNSIAIFFSNAVLDKLLPLIGLSFLITTVALVNKTLLEKELKFKDVIIVESLAIVISSIIGIVSAVQGFGVYSLIFITFSNTIILALGFFMREPWRPSLVFKFEDIKAVWHYSMHLTGFAIINYFSRQSDHFIIAKFIGSGALGIYSIAYKIMLYPLENIARVIVRVLFPAFSEVKHDNERFKKGYLTAIKFIALITFPLMLGLMATANNFVLVIFGEDWKEMALILTILAPIGLIQSIVTTTGSIYMAKGSTDIMFKIGSVAAVVIVTSFIIGSSFGLEGITYAYLVGSLIMLYPNLHFAWKQIDLKPFEGIKHLSPFIISSTIMGGLVFIVGIYLISLSISLSFVLILQVLTGIVIYLIMLRLFYFETVKSLVMQLRNRNNNQVVNN